MMHLSEKGEAFIKGFEKLRLTAYKPTPDDKWTIGWGHTGPEVVEGLVWTEEQAENAFLRGTRSAVTAVNATVRPLLLQDQFDALMSFTFNVGVDAEGHSTLVRLINAGYSGAVAGEWVKWDHQNGKVVPGLLERRKAELAMFQGDAATVAKPTS